VHDVLMHILASQPAFVFEVALPEAAVVFCFNDFRVAV